MVGSLSTVWNIKPWVNYGRIVKTRKLLAESVGYQVIYKNFDWFFQVNPRISQIESQDIRTKIKTTQITIKIMNNLRAPTIRNQITELFDFNFNLPAYQTL